MPADKSQDDPIQLSTNDLVGAIKQMLWELGAYLNQPVQNIDPAVVLGCLERMAQFNGKIPRPQQAQNGAQPEQRAN